MSIYCILLPAFKVSHTFTIHFINNCKFTSQPVSQFKITRSASGSNHLRAPTCRHNRVSSRNKLHTNMLYVYDSFKLFTHRINFQLQSRARVFFCVSHKMLPKHASRSTHIVLKYMRYVCGAGLVAA